MGEKVPNMWPLASSSAIYSDMAAGQCGGVGVVLVLWVAIGRHTESNGELISLFL